MKKMIKMNRDQDYCMKEIQTKFEEAKKAQDEQSSSLQEQITANLQNLQNQINQLKDSQNQHYT